MNYRQMAIFVISFSIVGFFLNLIWEYLQCAPYFCHGEENPNLGSMLKASAGDVFMMFFVYVAVSVTKRSWIWFSAEWNFVTVILISMPSIAISVLVEFLGLSTERWTYTDRNPVIPWIGVSLLPVLQMLFINPVSFYTSKKTASAF